MRRCKVSANEITFINLKNHVDDCFFRLNGLCYHKDRSHNACEGEKCKHYRSGSPLKEMKNISEERSYKKRGESQLTTRRNHRNI